MLTACHFIGILLVGLVKVNVLSVSVLVAKEAGAVAHHLNGAYHSLPTAGNTITLVGHGREMEALILDGKNLKSACKGMRLPTNHQCS